MPVIIMLALALAAIKLAELAIIMLIDGLATAIAVYYCWRSDRVMRGLLAIKAPCSALDLMPAWTANRPHRRLLNRHLRLSIAMTVHFSQFPVSSGRGHAIARAIFATAA